MDDFIYDIPEQADARIRVEAAERNAAVLGKAVHPGALARLHELYPDVRVEVHHRIDADDFIGPGRSREQWHVTRITLRFGDGPSDYLWAEAKCHPDDRYERREGIKLAFRRALESARKRKQSESYTEAWRELVRKNARVLEPSV